MTRNNVRREIVSPQNMLVLQQKRFLIYQFEGTVAYKWVPRTNRTKVPSRGTLLFIRSWLAAAYQRMNTRLRSSRRLYPPRPSNIDCDRLELDERFGIRALLEKKFVYFYNPTS
jgi:hypothetical protein